MNWNLNIEIEYSTLFIISLLINFILVAILIFIKVPLNSDDAKKSFYFISKKDLIYWILIISMFSIINFTYSYKEENDIISHWGFAGTVVSIILAVIAILFTLYQTFSGDLASQRINDAVKTLEDLTQTFDTASLQDSATNMRNASNLLENHINDISNQFKNFDDRFKDLENNFEKNSINDNAIFSPGIAFSEELLEDFLSNNFENMALYPRFFIYSHLKAKYLYKDILNIKKNRVIIHKTLVNIVVLNDLNGESFESELEKRGYKQRAAAKASASNGAVHSLLINLGIINLFSTLTEQRQEELLGLALEKIKNKNLIKNLDDKFIETLFEE